MKKLPDKAYLRVDEVAKYFDVSRATIYNWLKSGRLIGIRLGKYQGIRIPRGSIEAFEKEAIQRFWSE